MISKRESIIVSAPEGYLDEGLFGRVFLWIFDVLPYLQKRDVYPLWRIPSSLYGYGDNNIIIPGVLDLAYAPPKSPAREVSLVDLRNRHCRQLGPDWQAAHALWSDYFRVP